MYLCQFPDVSKSLVDNPRFRRLIDHLHALGPRPVGEFVADLHRLHADLPIQYILERYTTTDPATVRALGADRRPPNIFLVTTDIKSGSATPDDIQRQSRHPIDDGDAA